VEVCVEKFEAYTRRRAPAYPLANNPRLVLSLGFSWRISSRFTSISRRGNISRAFQFVKRKIQDNGIAGAPIRVTSGAVDLIRFQGS
jgi:hypothetical protein